MHMHAHVTRVIGFANFSASLATLPHLSSKAKALDTLCPRIQKLELLQAALSHPKPTKVPETIRTQRRKAPLLQRLLT